MKVARSVEFLPITDWDSKLTGTCVNLFFRTGSNSHVQLTDHLSSETYSVSGEASDRLVNFFSSSSFFASATLHVGGAALQPMMEVGLDGL